MYLLYLFIILFIFKFVLLSFIVTFIEMYVVYKIRLSGSPPEANQSREGGECFSEDPLHSSSADLPTG
uniref:Uncharacterized protein n=1 Tax=Anguilla anguilla TaxID=7936 RepID=A0A0E9RLA4_ANGAN